MQRKEFLRYLGAAAVPPVLTACGGGDTVVSVLEPLPGSKSAPVLLPALSAEEIAGLYYMREEEKLAHDVYLALYAKWGAQVFNNIAQSETQHTEAVRSLILATVWTTRPPPPHPGCSSMPTCRPCTTS